MTQTLTLPGPVRRHRLLRKWWWRGLAALVVVLALAYASLPWWLPGEWLAARISRQLSNELGVAVRVGSLSAGWAQGLVIEDVTLADPVGSVNPFVARIARIQSDFTPLSTLFTDRLSHLEVIRPEVWLVRGVDDRLNVERLTPSRHGRLPTWRFVVRDATCHVWTPTQRQSLHIDQLDCRLDPDQALMMLSASAWVPDVAPANRVRSGRLPSGPLSHTQTAGTEAGSRQMKAIPGRSFTLNARLVVPQLRRELDLKLGGQIKLEWSHLALNDLPLALIPRLPFEQVGGSTSGGVTLRTHPDLSIEFEQHIVLEGVRLVWHGVTETAAVPDAELRCGGRWDPTTDVLELRHFDYSTQAIRLHNRYEDLPAVRIDSHGRVPLELQLAGRTLSWQHLLSELPPLAQAMSAAGVDVRGEADFQVGLRRKVTESELDCIVEGANTALDLRPAEKRLLQLPRGMAKRLEWSSVRHLETGVMTPGLRLTIGETSLNLEGRLDVSAITGEPAPGTDWLLHLLKSCGAHVSLSTRRLEELITVAPVLACLPGSEYWAGPLKLQSDLIESGRHHRLSLSLAAEPQTRLRISDLFEKPEGAAFSLSAGLSLPHELNGRIPAPEIEIRCGAGRVVLAPEAGHIEYRFAPASRESISGEQLEATALLPIRVEGVEHLLAACPAWARMAGQGSGRTAAGSVELRARASLSFRPGDWLMRTDARVNATDLILEWDDLLRKSATDPLVLEVAHELQIVSGQREQSVVASIERPSGHVEAGLAFAGVDSSDPADDFEQLLLRARIRDLPEWLGLSPRLDTAAQSVEPTGAVDLRVDSVLAQGRRSLTLAVDADEAGLRLAEDGIAKPVGAAAHASLSLEAQEIEGFQRWRLVKGQARLADAEFREITGELVTGLSAPRAGRLFATGDWQFPDQPWVQSLDLQVRGSLGLTDELRGIHGPLQALMERFGLDGRVDWRAGLSADEEGFAAQAECDARALALEAPLAHTFISQLVKPAGVPAHCSLAVKGRSWRGNTDQDVQAQFEAEVDGNGVSAEGRLHLAGPWGDCRLGDADLKLGARLDQPARLLTLLPGSGVESFDGRCVLSTAVKRRGEQWSLSAGEASMDGLEIGFAGTPLHAGGTLTWGQDSVSSPGLKWGWGRSAGTLSGAVRARDESWTGRLGLALDRLDVDEIVSFLAPPSGVPDQTASIDDALRPYLARLAASELAIHGHVGEMKLTLPPGVAVVADAVVHRVVVDQGNISLEFSGLVDGGAVTGTVTTKIDEPDPAFRLVYTADQIQPGPMVDNYLQASFPGMKATGPLTLVDESNQKLFAAPGEANYPTGKGEFIVAGGTVAGRAAPLVITKIFPGLNLATFEFSYMHSWFQKTADGNIHHQMIYQGRYYNIYMAGHSGPDGFRYEVGVDFLADFDSKYWADSGQGRVPLFTKTGKIRLDGSIEDETVTYLPPHRILDTLFVRNNPVVTAYHAVRKRVRAEQ